MHVILGIKFLDDIFYINLFFYLLRLVANNTYNQYLLLLGGRPPVGSNLGITANHQAPLSFYLQVLYTHFAIFTKPDKNKRTSW
jgi:hypothetical protein